MDNDVGNVSLLKAPALAKLIASTPVVEYTTGETLYQSGEPCVSLPVIESGNARIYASGIAGRQIALYRLKAGAICPISLSALLQHSAYPATAIAEISVRVRYLSGEKLKAIICSTPELFSAFLYTFTDCLFDSECTAHRLIVDSPEMKLEQLLYDDQLAESLNKPGTTRVVTSRLSGKH